MRVVILSYRMCVQIILSLYMFKFPIDLIVFMFAVKMSFKPLNIKRNINIKIKK